MNTEIARFHPVKLVQSICRETRKRRFLFHIISQMELTYGVVKITVKQIRSNWSHILYGLQVTKFQVSAYRHLTELSGHNFETSYQDQIFGGHEKWSTPLIFKFLMMPLQAKNCMLRQDYISIIQVLIFQLLDKPTLHNDCVVRRGVCSILEDVL